MLIDEVLKCIYIVEYFVKKVHLNCVYGFQKSVKLFGANVLFCT